MLVTDYRNAIENAQKDDFVYLDPPYNPLSYTSNFTAYTPNGFGRENQVQLANVFRKLADRGCFVLAKNNLKILGLAERIRFHKRDIFRSDYSKRKFNLFVSNLVFHNFGRKRFDAYERLAQWATSRAYIVLGDLFFDYKKDSKILTSLFGNVQEKSGSMIDGVYKMLVLSKPKK